MLIDYKTTTCPRCGARNTVMLDLTALADEFIEDCQVCCSPIVYTVVNADDFEALYLHARRENE